MKNCIYFFGLIMIILGCTKVENEKNQDLQFNITSLEISTAKLLFNINESFLETSDGKKNSLRLSLLDYVKSPNWSDVKKYSIGDEEILQFNVTFSKRKGFAIDANLEKRRSYNEVEALTYLIFSKKRNSEISYALMTIIPSDYGRKNLKKGLNDINYKNVSKDFSGLIVFHSWKNEFMNGWEYKDGIIISNIEKEVYIEKNNIQKELYDDACGTFLVSTYCQDCTTWYVNGVYSHESCSSVYICNQSLIGYPGCNYTNGSSNDPGGYTTVQNPIENTLGISEIYCELKTPCFINALDLIQNPLISTPMGTLLHDTYGINGQYNLTVKEKKISPVINSNGTTSPVWGTAHSSNSGVTININTDLLPNVTQEFVVATFLHEIAHGFIFSAGIQGNLQEHTEMANFYVEAFANSLLGIFPTLTRSKAEALAWDGLKETQAYLALSVGFKFWVDTVNEEMRTGRMGTVCN